MNLYAWLRTSPNSEFPRWIIAMKRLHILRRMTTDVYMQCFKNYLPGLVLFVSMRSWLMYLCAIFSRMLFLFFNFFEREIRLLWCSVYDITERTPKMGCKYFHKNFQKLRPNVKVMGKFNDIHVTRSQISIRWLSQFLSWFGATLHWLSFFFCQVVLIGGESFGRSSLPSWFQPKIQLRVLDNLQQVKTLLEAPKAVP